MSALIYDENPVLKILQSIGDISMESFNDRLRYQKIAYLSQQMGSDGGFSFTYYHYGPYSPRLTKMLYKGLDMDSFSRDVGLTDQEAETVGLVAELIGDKFDDHDLLELFATVWYLVPFDRAGEKETVEIIAQAKPRFSREQIRSAMNRVLEFRRNHGLPNGHIRP